MPIRQLKNLTRLELLAIVAGASLLFTLVLRYLLIEKTNLNWDEFNFLAAVYVAASGEETRALQTAYAHLFTWIVRLPGNEIDQLLVARYVMFLLAATSASLLAWIGWRLIGGSAGVFAAFVCGSFAFVLQHGTSFRYDPIIVTCYLGAAAALLAQTRPLLGACVAGLLSALALLISIKSFFLFGALAALASLPLAQASSRRDTLARLLVFGALTLIFAAIFYGLHVLTLTAAEVSDTSDQAISSAADRAIDFRYPLPQAKELIETLRWDLPTWALLLVGLVIVGGDVIHRRDIGERVRGLQLLALASPLLTVFFYRNSFPYYYVTILPGACLLAGAVWRRLELLQLRPIVLGALLAAAILPPARNAWLWYSNNHEDEISIQAYAVEAVHEVFPQPVAYIDRCGMIASFDKAGPFMTTWVMGDYQRAGVDIMPGLLRAKQPKFVLANSPALDLRGRQQPSPYQWRPGDYRLLQENFVHHWGPIWVAGKLLEASSEESLEVEILIGGPYTVESTGAVDLDGDTVKAGDVVELPQGKHSVRSLQGGRQRVTLRWGAHLSRPDKPEVDAALFRGFQFRWPLL